MVREPAFMPIRFQKKRILRLAEARALLARLAQLVHYTEQENARLRAELAQLRQSTSWKLTAPLRWARAGALGLKRD